MYRSTDLPSVSRKYWQFFLAHAGTGIGGTLMYAPSTSVSMHWFMKKRSTAVGIVNCGSGLGGIIYPIMIKRLVDMLGGSLVEGKD